MKDFEVRGSIDFIKDVREAIDLLSTTPDFEEHFVRVVKRIQQARYLNFTALMKMNAGRGTVLFKRGVPLSVEDLCHILAHEAFHNVLYHRMIKEYGRWKANWLYRLRMPAIELKCIQHQMEIAKYLDINTESVQSLKVFARLIPNEFLLPEQVAILRDLKSKLKLV